MCSSSFSLGRNVKMFIYFDCCVTGSVHLSDLLHFSVRLQNDYCANLHADVVYFPDWMRVNDLSLGVMISDEFISPLKPCKQSRNLIPDQSIYSKTLHK